MKICYFGIYNRNFSRNKVYMHGLGELGVEIVECQSNARNFLKYWHLWRKHREIVANGGYDALIVGYPGHIVVKWAKILSRGSGKPVIADLLGSLYDAEIHSHKPATIKRLKARVADWLAVKYADSILLESEAQKKYFEGRFGPSKKYAVVYTGVDEGVYSREVPMEHGDSASVPHKKFQVFFRGKLTPECGIEHVLDAAEILLSQPHIQFKIIGRGYLLEKVQQTIKDKKLTNVDLVSRYLSDEEMRDAIRGASLYLGQFEDNHRLKRTIPHKAFEAFVAGIPYLSSEAAAIQELVVVGKTGFLVPKEDGAIISSKILELSYKPDLLAEVSKNAKKMYEDRLTPRKLAEEILTLIRVRDKRM